MTTRWMRARTLLTCATWMSMTLVANVGFAPRAAAQEAAAADVSEETREQARSIFAEGVTALDGGDCPTALAKFREAYGMVREPTILYNLATAESECHDIASAAEHYQAFLDQVRSGRAARYRPDARRQLATIRRQLGHLDLDITGLEATDDVHVDDRTIATTAVDDVPVAAGDHVIVVQRSGAEWGRQTATTAAGQHLTVAITLTAPVVVPTPEETAVAADTGAPETNPLTSPTPNRRRRRIIIGSSVAGAVVIGVIVGVVVATR